MNARTAVASPAISILDGTKVQDLSGRKALAEFGNAPDRGLVDRRMMFPYVTIIDRAM